MFAFGMLLGVSLFLTLDIPQLSPHFNLNVDKC